MMSSPWVLIMSIEWDGILTLHSMYIQTSKALLEMLLSVSEGSKSWIREAPQRLKLEVWMAWLVQCFGQELFLTAWGYNLENVLIAGQSESAMKLESNGRASAGKRSRHLNIRYFIINDMQEKGHNAIKYCPTDKIHSVSMSINLCMVRHSMNRGTWTWFQRYVAAQLMMVGMFGMNPWVRQTMSEMGLPMMTHILHIAYNSII